MDIEYTKIEDKPKDWPANEIELHLDNISNCLDEFVKNPNHETKEILISLVSNYDLNQQSHLGILRTTKYEVAQINSLFIRAQLYNITPLKVYLYELVGTKTRIQKIASWFPEAKETVEISEFKGLLPPLLLYHITYQTYILSKDKEYAEYLIEYAKTVIEQKDSKLHEKFLRYFISMLNDISYFNCTRTAGIWAFNRAEIYHMFKLVSELIKLSKQNPLERPLKGVLMTCIGNYILKSRNNYNEGYVCKYISPEVAVKSLKNREVWISEINKLNDEREQKVVSELFKDNGWNIYKWAQNIDFTPQRRYYVSCFSKSINNEKMKEKYGSCIYGYKNDKIAEMIVKGTMNALISFTANDFANFEYLKGLSNDENKKQQLDELVAKIKALTPQKNLRALDTDVSAIMESEGFAVRQYSRVKAEPKILEQLRNAMLAFKMVRFDYPINEVVKTITLNPYGLVIADKYYLVGFSEYVNALRQYRVDKIINLTILDEYFEKDEKFSLTDYCNNSFGVYQQKPLNITLEFNKSVEQDVFNYHFHPTQKIKKLDSGNIQVKFTSGGTYAICQELFKWGCDVKIKKPAELKTYYKKYLSDVLNNQ